MALTYEDPQRHTPRFPFLAKAKIMSADSIEATRVTELSLYGCYLETTAALPRGTRVLLNILIGGQCFEATASILYSHPTLGMGVVCREVKPTADTALQEWLQQSLDKQKATSSIEFLNPTGKCCRMGRAHARI
jgi:hypothetical protein